MKKIWIIVLLVIEVLIPVVIHFMSSFFDSEITADGLLGFIGNSIAATITAIIALYACIQTNEANILSERLLKLEEYRQEIELRPSFAITDFAARIRNVEEIYNDLGCLNIQVGNKLDSEYAYGIEIEIMNTSNGFEFLWLDHIESKNTDIKWQNSITGVNVKTRKIEIPSLGRKTTYLYAGKEFWDSIGSPIELTVVFNLRNRLDTPYKGSFEIVIMSLDFGEKGFNKKPFLYLEIQNYKTERYTV